MLTSMVRSRTYTSSFQMRDSISSLEKTFPLFSNRSFSISNSFLVNGTSTPSTVALMRFVSRANVSYSSFSISFSFDFSEVLLSTALTRYHLADGERLGDIVIRPEIEPCEHIVLRIFGREEDDRGIGRLHLVAGYVPS